MAGEGDPVQAESIQERDEVVAGDFGAVPVGAVALAVSAQVKGMRVNREGGGDLGPGVPSLAPPCNHTTGRAAGSPHVR
jgi:hypothetical protein